MATAAGFDCEFVHSPSEHAPCPICLLVVREPYQATCCGKTFCQKCIEHVQHLKKACPTCNEMNFTVFPDMRLQLALYSCPVYCTYRKDGCEWTGQLRELESHMNENPKPGEQLVGCTLAKVECIHCAKPFQRNCVTDHQNDCNRRPYSCDYCNNYEAEFESVVQKHWPVCGSRPVPCPNECNVYPERQNLEHHVSKECPLTEVKCNFHYAGCEVKLARKDLPSHQCARDSLVVHMNLLAAYSKKQMEDRDLQIVQLTTDLQESRQKINQLEKDTQQLKEENKAVMQECRNVMEEVAQLKAKQESIHDSPVEFTMPEFEEKKRSKEIWYSKPFYTHPNGYKMCLKVYANGHHCGEGTHISVFACLMKGPFDDHLKWPFQGIVTVLLLNQLGDEYHHTVTINFGTTSNPKFVSRVTKEERASLNAWGSHVVLPHSSLGRDPEKNCQFLKDNCLRFRITQD